MLPAAGRAQHDETGGSQGLAPVADILSASSSLLVRGLDPRYGGVGLVWDMPNSSYPAAAPQDPGSGSLSPNALVSRQLGFAPVNADPNLAVDPRDADHLVLAVNALDLPGVATYTSFDGGASWQGPLQVPYAPGDSGSAGSPDVEFDREGNVYLVAQSFLASPAAASAGQFTVDRSRISVSRSEDGGLTWGNPVTVALSSADTLATIDDDGMGQSAIARGFLDRPAIAIGPAQQRPEREIIYIAYTDVQSHVGFGDGGTVLPSARVTDTTIRLARSTDGGQTWNTPVAISPTVTRVIKGDVRAPQAAPDAETVDPLAAAPAPPSVASEIDANRVVQGAQVGVLADGTVLAAYLDSTEDGPHQGLASIMVAISEDGGRQFSEPVQAGLFREVHERPRTAFFPWWGTSFPRVAIGPADEVYIAVTARPADQAADDADIVLLRSLDRGSTWQTTTPAGEDGETASQFFPALDVAPDGSLVALWADMREDPSRTSYVIYAATSPDRGESWQGLGEADASAASTRLSDTASNALLGFPAGRFLGDRFAVAATSEDIFGAWADTRLAGDAPNLQIAFARQRPIEPADTGNNDE